MPILLEVGGKRTILALQPTNAMTASTALSLAQAHNPRPWTKVAVRIAVLALLSLPALDSRAQDRGPKFEKPVKVERAETEKEKAPAPAPKTRQLTVGQEMAAQLREAIEQSNASAGVPVKAGKSARLPPVPSVTVKVEKPAGARAEGKSAAVESTARPMPRPVAAHGMERHFQEEQLNDQFQRARAIALGQPVPARAVMPRGAAAAAAAAREQHELPHWAYEGAGGPQAWAKLKPEYGQCASGKRQSPIHIEESAALQGPAETLGFEYRPSTASVVNNGHTIQVDVEGDNFLVVRGSRYKLLQFHFHHPAEEKINFKGFAMVAHLVHRNDQGQLAVVAVLLDPGAANPFIDKVWTYMPLEVNDRVRTPPGWIDLAALLPQDQRYYQFMGSLTTPPCSEGVLWMVLKQPVAASADQLKLFAQLFPNNARPVQALNGRIVRDAQGSSFSSPPGRGQVEGATALVLRR
jgi:carbonic anhydrase